MIQEALVKWLVILGGVLLVLVSSYLYGYIGGRANVQTKWDRYKEDIAIEVQKNVLAAKQKELENEKATSLVTLSHSNDLARLGAALNRLRNQSPRPMPPTTNLPQSPDGVIQEPAGGAADYEFYSGCLTDALQIEAVKNWITLQGIPVK